MRGWAMTMKGWATTMQGWATTMRGPDFLRVVRRTVQ